MVIIGYSNPYVALYEENNGVVSYTGTRRLAYGVSIDASVEVSDTTAYRADDRVLITLGGKFNNGTITLEGTEMVPETAKMVLGLGEQITLNQTSGAKAWVYKDGQPPLVGLGITILYADEEDGGAYKWVPMIFPKGKFSVPGLTAETLGDSINFQNQTLEFTIETLADGTWKYVGDPVSTSVDDAKTFYTDYFNGN